MSVRRKFDLEFQQCPVRILLESGRPVAQVVSDLGVNQGRLGGWVAMAREERGGDDVPLSESERGTGPVAVENAELRMQRHVLKRSTALWVRAGRSPRAAQAIFSAATVRS